MENNKNINNGPTKNEIVKGKIANALTSAAKNHIVATTDDIYDTNLLEYQDEINKSLDNGITEILDELQYVAKEDTLVAGVSNIINDVDSQANTVTSTINSKTENIIDTVNGQANAVIDTVNSQAGNVINSVNTNTTNVVVGQAHGIQDNINAKTTDILNTVNAQAQAISASVVNQTAQIISNNNQQTSTITSTINQQAQSTNNIINSKTGDIINTVNTQAQSLANDIVNLDGNLDSGVRRIFDAINLIKEELQGQNSAITLTYLYDTLGDLSTLLDEINGEEMPVEFATDYARQGENSGATLSEVQTQATSAANDAAAAKTAAQNAETTAQGTANKNEILAAITANTGIPTLTIPNTTAAQELAPNVLYIFAERTSSLTLTLGVPIVGIANEYHFFVVCGATAPTINFPAGITWNGGSAPTITADKAYEVSILNNIAAYFEV